MRNMFQTLDRNGMYIPAELEVEHHLVSDFADGLMQAGTVFPLIRWCNPGNSREKRAEHFNRAKKYGVEKRTQVASGDGTPNWSQPPRKRRRCTTRRTTPTR